MGRIILPDQYTLGKGETGFVPHNLMANLSVGMAGYYSFEVRKARTGKLKLKTEPRKNIITDRGLIEYWNLPHLGTFDTGSIAANCAVGTGNATPTIADVGLANFRASAPGTATSGTAFSGPNVVGYVPAVVGPPAVPPYWFSRWIYQFGTGNASGNLTEVGTYPGGANANLDLMSRSLILDSNGNPTSITVLSDEVLTVTWELRYYVDTADHAFNFNLNGTRIDGTYRIYNGATQRAIATDISHAGIEVDLFQGTALVNPLNGSLVTRLGVIGGSTTPPTYVQFVNDLSNTGTCYADTQGTFGTGNGTGTIGSFQYQAHMWNYQFAALSSPIVKTSGQQLRVAFRQSWGRFTG